MSGTALCVKTPKGIEEVEKRAHGLPHRARRVLIMADGKRDAAGLANMFPSEDIPTILDDLLAKGFLSPLEVAPPRTSMPRPVDDAERFEMAKNFMSNTVSAFLGVMGSSLLDKLEGCADFAELRALYPNWREAIQLSGDGRKQATDLENRLAAMLS